MTANEGAIARRLAKRTVRLLRGSGFVVSDNAAKDFFKEFPLGRGPAFHKSLMTLVSLAVKFRKVRITNRSGAQEVADQLYVQRQQLEKDKVLRETLNDLIGKIVEVTPKDSFRESQKEDRPDE